MAAPPSSYRPDIDGLRAVAVLGVLLCHADLGLPGGFVGVDVFFVISGYLITGLILKDLRAGSFSLASFWERRVRRILPALLAVVAASLGAGWFVMAPDDYLALGRSVIGLALLGSNVQFWRETGYFDAAADQKPLLHTWSLAVEEQFYVLLPPMLMILARWRGAGRVMTPLLLLAVASLALAVYGVSRAPSATFYLLPTRAWELLAGSLLACVAWGRAVVPDRMAGPTATAGLAAILIPCFAYTPETPFPGIAALPPTLGAVLLIAAGADPLRRPPVSRLLASRGPVFIGLISYSLYLWHWPLLAFAHYTSLGPLSPGLRLGLVLASLVLAALSWRFVEVPFRSQRLLATRGRLLGATALSYAAMLAAGLGLLSAEGLEQRLPPQSRLFVVTGRRDPQFTHDLEAKDVPDNLIQLGIEPNTPAVLVWGDSHAMSILPAIDAICREAGVAGRAATRSSTEPVLRYTRPTGRMRNGAVAFNTAVMQYAKTRRIQAVILVAYWSTSGMDDGFRKALLETVTELQDSGATVYFMSDVPAFEFNVPKSLFLYSRFGWKLEPLAISRAQYDTINGFQATLIPQLQRLGVQILDPLPILQARTRTADLQPFDQYGSFYFDRHHLSPYGAMVLKPLFAPVVQSLASGRHQDTGTDPDPSSSGPRD